MTSPFSTALILLALGAAVVPATGQERMPRSGAPTAAFTVVESTPGVRGPRAGAPVAVAMPAATELAFAASGVAFVGAAGEPGGDLCGRKYCGASGSGR